MLLSLEWLREYVALPEIDPWKLAHELTMCTVEVEGVEKLSEKFNHVVVARIDALEPHPNAERLTITRCAIGNDTTETIVCGGDNLRVGMLVALALPGAVVKNREGEKNITVQKAVVRGVESNGMICSSGELGLTDLFPSKSDHDVIDLVDYAGEPGQLFAKLIGYDDVIFEIDNKSLTNRPDLWSHYGMARELAAIFKVDLAKLPDFVPPAFEAVPHVENAETKRCMRYTALRLLGIPVQASPTWLRSRLARVGQRPINLPIDLTNYVLMAIGQPSHAFDTRFLNGGIIVRAANGNEKIRVLDGSEITLSEADLVIADSDGPMALAGVIGGAGSMIKSDTTDLVLEMAAFDPLGIRKTSRKFGIRTESSIRFEKGQHPKLIDKGLGLFWSLASRICPDLKVAGFRDLYPTKSNTVTIEVAPNFLHRKLGVKLPTTEIEAVLKRVGFGVNAPSDAKLQVTVPFWRSMGDITMPEDIVEEVARLYGYENFNFSPPIVALTQAVSQPRMDMARRVKETLAQRCGFVEIFSYPWVLDRYLEAAGLMDLPCLKLHSPTSPDAAKLQPSLVPQILQSVVINLRYFKEFRIFEQNNVYQACDFAALEDEREKLPAQYLELSGAVVCSSAEEAFRIAKGTLETLNRTAQWSQFHFADGQTPWTDPQASQAIMLNDKIVGYIGAVSSRVLRISGIRRGNVALFTLNLSNFEPNPSRTYKFEIISDQPQVNYDLSVVVPVGVRWKLIAKVAAEAHALVRLVSFIDEYRGESINPGSKSITLRLLIGSDERTLSENEIDDVATKVVGSLKEAFGAVLRE